MVKRKINVGFFLNNEMINARLALDLAGCFNAIKQMFRIALLQINNRFIREVIVQFNTNIC